MNNIGMEQSKIIDTMEMYHPPPLASPGLAEVAISVPRGWREGAGNEKGVGRGKMVCGVRGRKWIWSRRCRLTAVGAVRSATYAKSRVHLSQAHLT